MRRRPARSQWRNTRCCSCTPPKGSAIRWQKSAAISALLASSGKGFMRRRPIAARSSRTSLPEPKGVWAPCHSFARAVAPRPPDAGHPLRAMAGRILPHSLLARVHGGRAYSPARFFSRFMDQFGIGLAGLGNVGAGVFKHLAANRALLRERLGFELAVRRIAVREPGPRARPRRASRAADHPLGGFARRPGHPDHCRADGAKGGEPPPRAWRDGAEKNRRHWQQGAARRARARDLRSRRASTRCPVFFEAAVGGGIPIIKAIREAFVGNHIHSIHGIINGTSNYILTRMTEEGAWLRGSAARGAGGGLCGGRSRARCEWRRRRAQGDHPRLAGVWLLGSAGESLCRRNRTLSATRHSLCPTARLSHQAARHHQGRAPAARSKCASIPRSSQRSTCWPASTASSMPWP